MLLVEHGVMVPQMKRGSQQRLRCTVVWIQVRQEEDAPGEADTCQCHWHARRGCRVQAWTPQGLSNGPQSPFSPPMYIQTEVGTP